MYGTTTYATLNEALQDIANRSFYEDAIVRPENGQYIVEDDAGTGEESYMWTYEKGGEYSDDVLDYSRTHESCERYDEARHIRFNLDGAVAELEEGNPVIFKYVTLNAYCEDPEPCEEDHLVGWALIAFSGQ